MYINKPPAFAGGNEKATPYLFLGVGFSSGFVDTFTR